MRITLIVALAFLLCSDHPRAQAGAAPKGPWFGLALPSSTANVAAVRVGTRPPRPVVRPTGDTALAEFNGDTLKADVATIVGLPLSRGARVRSAPDRCGDALPGSRQAI